MLWTSTCGHSSPERSRCFAFNLESHVELLLWPGAGKEVDEERKGDSVLFQASQVSQVSHLQVIEQQDADDTGISRLTFFVADCIEVEGPAQKGPPGVGGDGVHGRQEEMSTAAEGVQLKLHPGGSWWTIFIPRQNETFRNGSGPQDEYETY